MSEAKNVTIVVKVDGNTLAEHFKHLGEILAAIEAEGGVVQSAEPERDKKVNLCGHTGNCRCATPKIRRDLDLAP